MNKVSSSEKCKMWSIKWSLCSLFIVLCLLFQMRRSTSIVVVRRRMKKETWESRGQCPHKRAYTYWLHFQNTLNCCLTKNQPRYPCRPFTPSSIINNPGESTLRRDFLRLQVANKERSEAQRRQQLEQQQNEEHKRLLLAERQKRIEEQKEQRRRLEEVWWRGTATGFRSTAATIF